eukprot:8130470-Karenia_brevis.AAC.1
MASQHIHQLADIQASPSQYDLRMGIIHGRKVVTNVRHLADNSVHRLFCCMCAANVNTEHLRGVAGQLHHTGATN